MAAFPDAPPGLKSIQPYLKIATEHDQRDLIGKFDILNGFFSKNLIVLNIALKFS